MGKVFNKGLSEDNKKEGILKGLKDIKDKNQKLLSTFSTTNKINKAPKNKINNQGKNLIYSTKYSFAKFKNIDDIKELLLDSMHKKLKDFHEKLTGLKNVTSQTKDSKKLKTKVLKNAGDLYNNLYYIYKNKYNKEINSLDTENKKKLDYKKLRLTDDYQYPSEEETSEKLTKTDFDELNEQIIKEETEINEEIFKNYFGFQKPTDMLKTLYNLNDKDKNNELVNVIKSGLVDLENEIENMSEDEIKIEKPHKIVNIVKEILKFNKQNQSAEGLKILTTNQILSRLPIVLAQLKAGNNS